MTIDIFRAFSTETDLERYLICDYTAQEIPNETRERRRGRKPLKPENAQVIKTVTIEEARAMIQHAITEYQETSSNALLNIGAQAGVGKTTIGTETAERAAASGRRVLYLGPRHDFFQDIQKIAKRPKWWYEWQPRQLGDERKGKIETCRNQPEIDAWMQRGYDAMSFCRNGKICGWDYINNHCPFHAQSHKRFPIVFGQHAHICGHPEMNQFDLIIGDEFPLQAFLHKWVIPGKFIAPKGMDIHDPYTEIVHQLSQIASRNVRADGTDLLRMIGSFEEIHYATESWAKKEEVQALAPSIDKANDVNEVPFFHLFSLAKLLHQESKLAMEEIDYSSRISINDGKLNLLLRKQIDKRAINKKILWLDATSNKTIYEAMFAPVRVETISPIVKIKGTIRQLWQRSNGKTSLLKNGETTSKTDQLKEQVTQIIKSNNYKNPAIITFQALEKLFEEHQTGHFYGNRGTNRYENCDCLIVAGTPQPDLNTIHTTAKMLFQEHLEAFNLDWSERELIYKHVDNQGISYSYPVSGFWHDEKLSALLWQYREAEIIQTAHRVRPIINNVDVWLITNIPIDELPPDELLRINDVFNAPINVDAYQWPDILNKSEIIENNVGYVTASDLVNEFKLSKTTASKYIDLIAKHYGWTVGKVVLGKGRPHKATGRGIV